MKLKQKNLIFLLITILSMPLKAQVNYVLLDSSIHKQLSSNGSELLKNSVSSQFRNVLKQEIVTLSQEQIGSLASEVHKVLHRCGGFLTFSNRRELQDHLDRTTDGNNERKVITKGLRIPEVPLRQFTQEDVISNWFSEINRNNMNEDIIHLSAYPTRYYTSDSGIEAMKWIASKWESLSEGRSDISVEKFKHRDFTQKSVILKIKGSTSPEKILVFGGHGDSINTDSGPKAVAPGADDNAAGVALLTEMIRLIVENSYSPQHTLVFIVYAAEEVGLQGSYEIARMARRDNWDVKAVMNFDGVNYLGKTYEMALISDLTNRAQNEFLGALIDKYIQVPWTYQQCHFACSDHASWNYEMFPASYPVETTADEQNPKFHTANDTFDVSNFDTVHAEKFLKLGISFLLERDVISEF